MVLLDNREVKKGWQPLKDSVCGLFQKHGAQIVSARRWDERRLAYPIKHQLRGTYLLVYFDADTQSLGNIRRDLEYNEAVLRYLTTTCDAVPPEAHEPEATFDESAVRVEDDLRPAARAEAEEAESAEAEEAEAESAEAEDTETEESQGEGGDSEGETEESDGESAAESDRDDEEQN